MEGAEESNQNLSIVTRLGRPVNASSFMPEHELTFAGNHHEIYLSDPRKVVAAKLKTVLRQPVVADH